MKYRLYVDEVGNSDMGASLDPNHRYLSLTGVAIELDYVVSTVHPALEQLKSHYFGFHPDEPIILHRKELISKDPPFESLRDPKIERTFNQDLLHILRSLDYTVITIVIDKLEHQRRYTVWRFDPYHYCLTALVERYVMWLRENDVVGDVMAESRGGHEDRRLKDSFHRVYTSGSDYVGPEEFAIHLTSSQLKVKLKSNNIPGLQLADLIAHPSFRATRARKAGQPIPNNFGGQIAKILEDSKYRRSPRGHIDGWGTKWLP